MYNTDEYTHINTVFSKILFLFFLAHLDLLFCLIIKDRVRVGLSTACPSREIFGCDRSPDMGVGQKLQNPCFSYINGGGQTCTKTITQIVLFTRKGG